MVVLCCREMEGADNPYLDALIRELDDSGDDAVNIEGGGIEPDGDPGDLDVDHDGGAAQEEDQDGDGDGDGGSSHGTPQWQHHRDKNKRETPEPVRYRGGAVPKAPMQGSPRGCAARIAQLGFPELPSRFEEQVRGRKRGV